MVASAGLEEEFYPTTHDDLMRGADDPGVCDSDPDELPKWLDKAKFARGQKFFRDHAISVMFSLHCSLTIGFVVGNVLDAVIFTRKSDTPVKAMKRYLWTAIHVLAWVFEEIYDSAEALGFRSLQTVRKMHKSVGIGMTKKRADTGKVYVTQYDMALVQCGFMGFVVVSPEGFGIDCTKGELEDFIHYWRGLGYLLGMRDEYNMCGGTYEETCKISRQLETEVLLPNLENKPENCDEMAQVYLDGMNRTFAWGIALSSIESIKAYTFDAIGLPVPKLSFLDTLRFWFFKTEVFLIRYLPGYKWFLNMLVRNFYDQRIKRLDLKAKDYAA